MRHAPILLSLLFSTPLSASLACTSSTSSTSSGAGWSRTVSTGGASAVPYAVGELVKLTVTDELVGPQECHEEQSSGCGGPYQSCSSPHKPNRSVVASVECRGNCEATATPSPAGHDGVFELRIFARQAGLASVIVKLRDESGDVRETAVNLTFLRATHIGLTRALAASPHGKGYAALPGAWFAWCAKLDAEGRALAYDAENIHVTVTGAEVQAGPPGYVRAAGRCMTFVAGSRGEIDVTVAYGELVRREKVRVVDVADVKGVELVQLGGAFRGEGEIAPIEDDRIRDVPVARGIAVTTDECFATTDAVPIVQRLTLWDGTLALAPATALTVSPQGLVSLSGAGPDLARATIAQLSAAARGTGTATSTVGVAHAEVPILVTGGKCLHDLEDGGDGGDGATNADAADAGALEEDASAAAP